MELKACGNTMFYYYHIFLIFGNDTKEPMPFTVTLKFKDTSEDKMLKKSQFKNRREARKK